MGVVVSLKGSLLVANPAMPDPNFNRTVVLLLAHEEGGALGVVLNRPSGLDVDSPLPRWEKLVADPPVVFVGGPVAPGAAICLARVPDRYRPGSGSGPVGPGAGARDGFGDGSDLWDGDGLPRGSALSDSGLADSGLADRGVAEGGVAEGGVAEGGVVHGEPASDHQGGWMPLVGELGTLDLERDPDHLDVPVEAIRVFAGYAGWGPGQLEDEIEAGGWFVVSAESGDALSSDPEQLWKRVLRRQGGSLAMLAAYPAEPSLN